MLGLTVFGHEWAIANGIMYGLAVHLNVVSCARVSGGSCTSVPVRESPPKYVSSNM